MNAEMGQNPIWSIPAPSSWAPPPRHMTVSTLAEIETCPMRWALANATYENLWTGAGYPPRLQLSAVSGSIVHLALELVTRGLVRSECASVKDAAAVYVLKELGGYTHILNGCIEQVLERFSSNPRAMRTLESIRRSLIAQVPDMRSRVQMLLGRLELIGPTYVGRRRAPPTEQSPLSLGAHPEVQLRNPELGWKGRADLVTIGNDRCEIVDVKTGAPSDSHGFQLWVYALLWNRDKVLNPTGRRADHLTLAYSTGNVAVKIPTETELDELAIELAARRQRANDAVATLPVRAQPSTENCRFCAVKHMCGVYWGEDCQRTQGHQLAAEDGFSDIEIIITARHGPLSWDAVVGVAAGIRSGCKAVLRSSGELNARVGKRIRIVDAHLEILLEEGEDIVIITIGSLTEVYAAGS